MFDHIFENRDKKVTNIVKLSDYLGRSLRENVEVFSIDDTESKATFITEGGKIIAGSYDFDDKIALNNIKIEEGELFENEDQFNDFVNYKISDFLQNVFEQDFAEADTSFNKVLQLWESRVKFSSVKDKLCEKSQKFNGSNRIIESEEFQKLVEIAPQLVEFLKENKNLVNIPEIKNMVRLSTSVSQAFNLPRLSYDNLQESGYIISEDLNHSIYDMICKQELVRKELVESKNKFNLVWLNNQKVSNLASLIYENDEAVIAKALVEAVCEVPYLALATKKQITETLTNNLELNESVKVNLKDIKSFSSLLFEYKKPLKTLFISMLNEKYGISVQNLKDIPTFRSLLNTQVLIFEALAKLSPKGSVVKEVLSENSKMLKTKNGVESIDVNQFIGLLFEKAEYTDLLEEDTIIENISLKETFSEIESIEELINVILENVNRGYPEKNIKPGTAAAKKEHKKRKKKASGGDEEDEKKDDDEGEGNKELSPKQKKVMDVEPAPHGDGDIDAKDLAVKRKQKTNEDEEAEETKEKVPTSDEIMADFKNFEDILNSINFEDIDTEETEEELETASEEEAEVDKEEEGEE
tara:strand:+ start:5776 stop:7524 length:1749 start_codon:yes stop_codon:yes gene_type:complete